MCGEALKSKIAFRGDAAHEIYTKIFAGNAAFYDPGNGGAPRTIRQAAGAGFYPSPDADLRNGHIPAADYERKQHREGAHRTVSKQRKNTVGLGVCPAAAEAVARSAGDAVPPLHSPATPWEDLSWLPPAGGGRLVAEIRRLPGGPSLLPPRHAQTARLEPLAHECAF